MTQMAIGFDNEILKWHIQNFISGINFRLPIILLLKQSLHLNELTDDVEQLNEEILHRLVRI